MIKQTNKNTEKNIYNMKYYENKKKGITKKQIIIIKKKYNKKL